MGSLILFGIASMLVGSLSLACECSRSHAKYHWAKGSLLAKADCTKLCKPK
jgi:hypothetical protein